MRKLLDKSKLPNVNSLVVRAVVYDALGLDASKNIGRLWKVMSGVECASYLQRVNEGASEGVSASNQCHTSFACGTAYDWRSSFPATRNDAGVLVQSTVRRILAPTATPFILLAIYPPASAYASFGTASRETFHSPSSAPQPLVHIVYYESGGGHKRKHGVGLHAPPRTRKSNGSTAASTPVSRVCRTDVQYLAMLSSHRLIAH